MVIWKKLKNGTKILCFKIPLPPRRRGGKKYFYPVVPRESETTRMIISSVQAERPDLSGMRALVYYHARAAGWEEEDAKMIAES
jgi:hypothetical protein